MMNAQLETRKEYAHRVAGALVLTMPAITLCNALSFVYLSTTSSHPVSPGVAVSWGLSFAASSALAIAATLTFQFTSGGIVTERADNDRLLAAPDALGFIDQTIYANDDSNPLTPWRNEEVIQLLTEIRAKMLADPAGVESRRHEQAL